MNSSSIFLRARFATSSLRIRSTPLRNLSTTTPRMSAAPQKFEFLCILPDKPGVEAKRLAVRPLHFAGLKPLVEEGFITWGGAMLNEVPTDDKLSFKGSAMTCIASSEAEVRERLAQDPYVVHGVWDMENATIVPYKCAVRVPLEKK